MGGQALNSLPSVSGWRLAMPPGSQELTSGRFLNISYRLFLRGEVFGALFCVSVKKPQKTLVALRSKNKSGTDTVSAVSFKSYSEDGKPNRSRWWVCEWMAICRRQLRQ